MNKLIAHIKAENAKTQTWLDEDPKNRWAGFYSEDVSWWKDQGVETMDDFDRWIMLSTISDLHKDAYGFRPHGVNYDEYTTSELIKEYDYFVKIIEDTERLENELRAKDEADIKSACENLNIDRGTYDRWMEAA